MNNGSVQSLYPALVEHSIDLIAVLDETGAITFQSQSVRRILGYEPPEMVGRKAFELIHPDDRKRVHEEFQRGRLGGGPTPFVEYRFLHKTKGWRVLESVGSVVHTPDGGRFGIVNSRDITEQRALKDQVHHAQHIATLGRTATGVVHEFHNSLQVILLHADLMSEAYESPELHEELEGIKRAAETAKGLARQLLDVSRTPSTARQTLNVNNAIDTMTPVLKRLVGQSVTFDTRMWATEPVVRLRAGALDQMLVNLVSNARDAIGSAGSIYITTRNLDDELVIEVTDTGLGIPLRLQAQIFEPFVTTKPCSQGTGLGLSTVREIVEEAGGRINVSSAVGCGSTFTISLPLADTADLAIERAFACGASL